MKRVKRFVAFGAAIFLMMLLAACSFPAEDDHAPAGVKHTIEFSDAAGGGETAESTDEIMEMVTGSPQLVHIASGEEYELQIVSSGIGTAVYTFETAEETVDLEDFEVHAPVQYVAESAEEVATIPLFGSSNLVQVEVSDSLEEFPNADQGVLVEFIPSDTKSVPYNVVLVSGGEVYDNCSTSYNFDNATGDLKDGHKIYFGITIDELSTDAYLEVESLFTRHVLSNFSLIE